MRGLVFKLPMSEDFLRKYPGLLRVNQFITGAIGKRRPLLLHRPPFVPLALRDIEKPKPPSDDWVYVKPLLCGICGSDISLAHSKGDARLPISCPCTIGHEVLVEYKGRRYAVNPLLSCNVRVSSWDRCDSCRRGMPEFCTNFNAGSISPGMFSGFTKGPFGGIADWMMVHRSQLFPYKIPDTLTDGSVFTDMRAVLVEPMSIAVHAVLNNRVDKDAKVLVVGGGMIAYATVAALRLIGHTGTIIQSVLHQYQAEVAYGMGADSAIFDHMSLDEIHATLSSHGCVVGRMNGFVGGLTTGGVDIIFDCIVSQRTIDKSLELTREGGTIVLLGINSKARIDLTHVITRGKHIKGSFSVGQGTFHSTTPESSFAITIKLMRESSIPLERLVTHTYSPEKWRDAFDENVTRKEKSIKTVFDLRQDTAQHGR